MKHTRPIIVYLTKCQGLLFVLMIVADNTDTSCNMWVNNASVNSSFTLQ